MKRGQASSTLFVEFPTKPMLSINLKNNKTLWLTVPTMVLYVPKGMIEQGTFVAVHEFRFWPILLKKSVMLAARPLD
jgi:hypothetical protein